MFDEREQINMWGSLGGAFTRKPLRLSWALLGDPGHWKGVVHSDVDLVAVTLAIQGGLLQWTKSQQLPVGAFVVGEPIMGFPVAFWIGGALTGATPGRTNIALYLRGEVRSTMIGEVSSATSFEIAEAADGWTGDAIRLVRLGTRPSTECGFLFLASSDVKVGRKGQWRLRPSLEASVTGTLGQVLKSGRFGELRVVEPTDAADERGTA